MATGEENNHSSDKEEGEEIQLEMVELTLGTLDLRESEIYPSRHKRRRRQKKEVAKNLNEGGSTSVCHELCGWKIKGLVFLILNLVLIYHRNE